jgi:hypothetical protein
MLAINTEWFEGNPLLHGSLVWRLWWPAEVACGRCDPRTAGAFAHANGLPGSGRERSASLFEPGSQAAAWSPYENGNENGVLVLRARPMHW